MGFIVCASVFVGADATRLGGQRTKLFSVLLVLILTGEVARLMRDHRIKENNIPSWTCTSCRSA